MIMTDRHLPLSISLGLVFAVLWVHGFVSGLHLYPIVAKRLSERAKILVDKIAKFGRK